MRPPELVSVAQRQPRVHLCPQLRLNDTLVLARIDGPLVIHRARIEDIREQEPQRHSAERPRLMRPARPAGPILRPKPESVQQPPSLLPGLGLGRDLVWSSDRL